MWAIKNHTPYKAAKTWGRDKNGVHQWIVAVKGTFDVREDGGVVLADQQFEPLRLPEYNGEPGESSVRYDADLIATKPTTDIVLNGTAYSPRGRPSEAFNVTLSVGAIRKTLRVRGHRRWGQGLLGNSRSAIEPVTEVPIVYERAFGGYDRRDPDPEKHRIDLRNPVGRGVVSDVRHQIGQAMANFEYPSGDIERAGPAGFGAIDDSWSPRRELQGTYDTTWQENRYPLLPSDWDQRSLLCSPRDQLPSEYLRGGEGVELENLTPSGVLRFALPKVFLRFRTRIDGRTEEHQGHLSSVVIEPDHLRVILVWQSCLAVRTNGDYLDETIVSEKTRLR